MSVSGSRLAILSPSYGIWGGGQIFIEELAKYLLRHGVGVTIACAEPEAFDVPTCRIPAIASRKDRLARSWQIAKLLKGSGFDHVLLNDLSSLWLAPVFKAAGLKVGSLLHMYLRPRSRVAPGGHGSLERKVLKLSAYFCDRIFSVNKENQSQFRQPVYFIGNYAPDWFFAEKIDDASSRIKKYDLIFVGRLAPEKNVSLLIDLLEALNRRSLREITLRIVGAGPLRAELERQIEDLGLREHVFFEPWAAREKLPELYDLGRVFAMTSSFEGFATTLLESHARGIPALVTESSGYGAEFVRDVQPATGCVIGKTTLSSDSELDRVLDLIDQSVAYHQDCITKARRFSADRVYAPIYEWCVGSN